MGCDVHVITHIRLLWCMMRSCHVQSVDNNAYFAQVVDSEQEESRLLLCEATAVIMRQCFALLGIKPLDRI